MRDFMFRQIDFGMRFQKQNNKAWLLQLLVQSEYNPCILFWK